MTLIRFLFSLKSKSQGEITGLLKLAVVSTGKYVMPYFLSEFMKLNEGVELAMDVTNKTRVVRTWNFMK